MGDEEGSTKPMVRTREILFSFIYSLSPVSSGYFESRSVSMPLPWSNELRGRLGRKEKYVTATESQVCGVGTIHF